MDRSIAGKKIKVTGIVQGVGFRPFVYGLAEKYALAGWVSYSSSGVDIVLEGPANALEQFLSDLQTRPPALARIDSCTAETVTVSGFSGFVIQPSL